MLARLLELARANAAIGTLCAAGVLCSLLHPVAARAQAPRLPAQAPRLPAQALRLPAQAPKLPAQAPKLFEVDVAGGRFVGMPVHWSRHDAVVLEPSGRMQFIEQSNVEAHRTLSVDFAPQSITEARVQLQHELGARYETVVFGPYVLAVPVGQAERWRSRFSSLLAGYVRYFDVRQWSLRRPDFPLCVVVYATRAEFLAYSQTEIRQIPSSLVGCYSPRSNRCALYNIDFGNETSVAGGDRLTNWSETEATIVHEAVHQLAYNTGIHQRLSMDPLWFVEGLASMFEQPSVYDLRQQQATTLSRMDVARTQRLRSIVNQPSLLLEHLQSLIVSDELFQRSPAVAYDLSWALTYYLAERMPTELRQYSSRLAGRPFGDYASHHRERDFRQAFGGDLSLLAGRLSRLLQEAQ